MIKYCILLLMIFFGSCSKNTQEQIKEPPKNPKQTKKNVVLFLGDSLTAGLGVAKEEAYPALIAENWKQSKKDFRVQNSAASGHTTKDVLNNLDWYITAETHTVFLAIGANDGMRGYDLAQVEKNIVAIINICQKQGFQVILAGMMIPPNYGEKRSSQFAAMYPKIAKQTKVKLLPFLLEGVAGKPKLNQKRGIHPTKEGHKIVASHVLKFFQQENLP